MPERIAADGLPHRRRSTTVRMVLVVGLLELASLAALVTNLCTADNAALARLVGPVHGFLYLVGIALVWSSTRRRRPRLLALVPGVGAVLAARDERGPAPSAPVIDRRRR